MFCKKDIMEPIDESATQRRKRLRELRQDIEKARNEAYNIKDWKTSSRFQRLFELQEEYKKTINEETEAFKFLIAQEEHTHDRLRQKTEDFINKSNAIAEENERLRRENETLRSGGVVCDTEVIRLRRENEELKAKLAEYEEKEAMRKVPKKASGVLKQELDKAKSEYDELVTKIDAYNKRMEKLEAKRSENNPLRQTSEQKQVVREMDRLIPQIRGKRDELKTKLPAAKAKVTRAQNAFDKRKAYEDSLESEGPSSRETTQQKRTRDDIPATNIIDLTCKICGSVDITSECGGCNIPKYCSIECAQEDWIEGGHYQECRIK